MFQYDGDLNFHHVTLLFTVLILLFVFRLVKEYIANDPRGRDSSCPVTTVKMASEPVTFTGFFPSWDVDFFSNRKSYSERMKQLYG